MHRIGAGQCKINTGLVGISAVDWLKARFSITTGREMWVSIIARDRDGLKISRKDYSIDMEVSSRKAAKEIHLLYMPSKDSFAQKLPQLPVGKYTLTVTKIFGYHVSAEGNSSLPLRDSVLEFEVVPPADSSQVGFFLIDSWLSA